MSITKVAILPNFAKHQLDFTWYGIVPEILGQLEALFCVVAACLPAIRQLFSKRLPNWFAYGGKKNAYAHDKPSTGGKLGGISVTRSTTTRFNALDGSIIAHDDLEDGPYDKHAEVTKLETCGEEVEPSSAVSDATSDIEKL